MCFFVQEENNEILFEVQKLFSTHSRVKTSRLCSSQKRCIFSFPYFFHDFVLFLFSTVDTALLIKSGEPPRIAKYSLNIYAIHNGVKFLTNKKRSFKRQPESIVLDSTSTDICVAKI